MADQHSIEDVQIGLGDAADRLDFVYEALGVREDSLSHYTPEALKGVVVTIRDVVGDLRNCISQLEGVVLGDLESGDGKEGKDGPLLAYALRAYVDPSRSGSDVFTSVNPSGSSNPRFPYAPPSTASEETPSLTTRGSALVPG